ncbi:hypothetical protein SAMCFNEI73_Ch1652 [Sinorhizobium americanum]|uniref:Uncharacterized protein n=1 Tax=Sinorhizobium americanum TaxID=194963 RepID=A0A1L3LLP5_9HYPH|nr:hypothetical protein SAMCFNEI73_Ch1652 [Sinorhizobium americanum]
MRNQFRHRRLHFLKRRRKETGLWSANCVLPRRFVKRNRSR